MVPGIPASFPIGFPKLRGAKGKAGVCLKGASATYLCPANMRD